MWEALAVGPMELAPNSRALGEAKLALYFDQGEGDVLLSATASWWTPDGTMRESSLQLAGELEDAYSLIDEASRWIWQRWKKPLKNSHGPFD